MKITSKKNNNKKKSVSSKTFDSIPLDYYAQSLSKPESELVVNDILTPNNEENIPNIEKINKRRQKEKELKLGNKKKSVKKSNPKKLDSINREYESYERKVKQDFFDY